jgi:hypothetical protein
MILSVTDLGYANLHTG